MIDTSQPQQQTGVLDLDIRDNPANPHPSNVLHGKDVSTRVLIRDNTDRVADGNIVINFISFPESTRIPNYIAHVNMFGNNILIDSGSSLLRVSVADGTGELRHG
jgi:hypothetical protein